MNAVPNPKQAANTKVERVVEAFEDMAIQCAVLVLARQQDKPVRKQVEAVTAAREECADALREFLKPMLRVAGQ